MSKKNTTSLSSMFKSDYLKKYEKIIPIYNFLRRMDLGWPQYKLAIYIKYFEL